MRISPFIGNRFPCAIKRKAIPLCWNESGTWEWPSFTASFSLPSVFSRKLRYLRWTLLRPRNRKKNRGHHYNMYGKSYLKAYVGISWNAQCNHLQTEWRLWIGTEGSTVGNDRQHEKEDCKRKVYRCIQKKIKASFQLFFSNSRTLSSDCRKKKGGTQAANNLLSTLNYLSILGEWTSFAHFWLQKVASSRFELLLFWIFRLLSEAIDQM